ncbi:MAG: hypothetical protein U9N57_14205 [Pseudomonadota bacterium]|nr:hypothetical protein [Pseudomonadota bacterium]
MNIHYQFNLDSTYRPSSLIRSHVLSSMSGTLNQFIENEIESIKTDSTLSEEDRSGKILLLTVMGSVGLSMMANSKDAQALFGEEWAAFDAATAPLIAGIQTLGQNIADKATDVAVDVYKDQTDKLAKMFSFTNDSVEEQGSLDRTASIGIADAKRAEQTEHENKREVAANQASPTSCANDALLKLAFNDYPNVKRLQVDHFSLNLNDWLEKKTDEAIQGDGSKHSQVEQTRATHPNDEHIDSANLRKTGAYSAEEEIRATQQIRASLTPFNGALPKRSDETLETEVGIEYETNRCVIKSLISLLADVRTSAFALRKGDESRFQEFKSSIEPLQSSMDSRDRAYYQAYTRMLNQIELDNGGRLSYLDTVLLMGRQREAPEFEEYLNRMGAEEAVYLRELILMKQHHQIVDDMISETSEVRDALLAGIVQLKALESVV